MNCVYNVEIDSLTLGENLDRIGNQIFKLLPMREEEKEWIKPLETLCIEILGLYHLFPDKKDILTLICKLAGLVENGDKTEFLLYRRTIFECCSLVSKVKEQCL